MKTKCVLCMLYVTAYAVTTLLICASCYNPWMAEILGLKTITFDSNGGTNIASQTLCKNQTVIPPPNPSKSGHEFESWYRDNETFEVAWDFKTVPTRDMTLYAKWEPTHTHQWGEWTVTANATETADGVEAKVCTICGAIGETRTAYATGTAGLSYALNGNAYSVNKGTVTSGTVHIPAYHRPNDDSPYLPVTSISDEAFQNLTNLNIVTIPSNVTTIGARAFYGCSSLESITIPEGVTMLNNSVFYGCSSLTSVTIPEGVTSIGSTVFYGCSSLTSITIPASVTTIANLAFNYCSNLTSVTFEGMISEAGFNNMPNTFLGDLREKYFAAGGGIGTYKRAGSGTSEDPYVWAKQP